VQEAQALQAEIDTVGIAQKEAIMQVTTSWEERGIVKGKDEERRSLARKMLQEGATLDFVTKVTGLTAEQLQQLEIEGT
jgi:predicted transposase/invertase (TIGR01784 family)